MIKTYNIKIFRVQQIDTAIIFKKTTYEQKEHVQYNINNTKEHKKVSIQCSALRRTRKQKEIIAIKNAHIESLISAKSIPTLYTSIYEAKFL